MAEIIQLAMYPDQELADQILAMAKERDRSTSATLIGIVREYMEIFPVRHILQIHRMNLITADEAVRRFAEILERDGNGAAA